MMWGYPVMWGWFMIVVPLIWFVGVALLLWAVVRWLQPHLPSGSVSPSASADDLLRQRYARGEIDETTFAHMQAVLRQAQYFDAPPTA
jgi:putative membrane protein